MRPFDGLGVEEELLPSLLELYDTAELKESSSSELEDETDADEDDRSDDEGDFDSLDLRAS